MTVKELWDKAYEFVGNVDCSCCQYGELCVHIFPHINTEAVMQTELCAEVYCLANSNSITA